MKLLREPLVHFLAIGAAIYLLYGVFAEPAPEADDKTIVVSAGEVEWMQTAWQKRWNRLPTAAELDGLIQQYIRESVLYREALTMGLNKHDSVIRRRLAQKLEFLAKDLVALTPPPSRSSRPISPNTRRVIRHRRATPSPRFSWTRTNVGTRLCLMRKKSRRH